MNLAVSNRINVRALACFVLSVFVAACGREALPDPPPRDRYPIAPRPPCSFLTTQFTAKVPTADLESILAAAQRGENMTCDDPAHPSPLDYAVLMDAPELVRAVLKAGADPNARWTARGDRFPLQAAIEPYSGIPRTHRREIVGLLLQHGADPNARWCPFESRMDLSVRPGCRSDVGVTPLIAAAYYDQADVTYLLLDAGADPALMDGLGLSAVDYATGPAVFELLLAARYRDPAERRAKAPALRTSAPEHLWLSPPPPPPPPPEVLRNLVQQARAAARARESPRGR